MKTEVKDEKEDAAEAADKKAIVKHRGEATSGGKIARLEIKSFAELENLAVILGKSDIVPKDMIGKPANILLALMFGNELGLTPAQALQNVMVVNGRPTLWGDAVMGLVIASGLQEWWKDEWLPDFEGGAHKFTTKRNGGEPVSRTFSMKDAEKAGLAKKEGPWQTYPKRMLFHRARSWDLRDVYPDVLKGIRVFEEERDFIEGEVVREESPYKVPQEKAAPETAPAATTAAAAAPESAPKIEGTPAVFKCSGGATTSEVEGASFVIRDDQDPPVKYYHDVPEWHAMAKAAKDAKVFMAGTWVEKPSKKGVIRWLTALSLKS